VKRKFWSYENSLMALLSLNFGVVFFDRNAMSYLGPAVQADLHLSNAQIGLIASGFSLAWGLSGFLGGLAVDRVGRRKLFLVLLTIVFSLCSIGSGLVQSFGALIAIRMLMGFAEGPMNPIHQSFVAAESSPQRLGLNMGFVQNFGSQFLGSFIAPLAIGALAAQHGWRNAFFVSALPGLAMAAALFAVLREPKVEQPKGETPARMSIAEMVRHRNVWLCMVISLFLIPWMVLGWTFLPLLYANYRGFDAATGSWLMATLGASAMGGAFLLPGLSDRIGRKPVMIFGSVLGALVPLSALYFGGSTFVLAALLFVGWLASGVFPLFMSAIPSETISARYVATTCGLIQGLGEAVGGFAAPAIAGKAADLYGLPAAMWIMAACAIVAGILSLGLKETAPAKVGRYVDPAMGAAT
jgi:MFS family permease